MININDTVKIINNDSDDNEVYHEVGQIGIVKEICDDEYCVYSNDVEWWYKKEQLKKCN